MVGFLKGLFGGKSKPEADKAAPANTKAPGGAIEDRPAVAAMKRTVAEMAKTDPTAPVRLTAEEILTNVLSAGRNERGVHLETVLGVIGSLGGYSCHIVARKRLAQMKRSELGSGDYVEAQTKSGTSVYFGNLINGPLCEMGASFWQVLAKNAEHLGAVRLPDVMEVLVHVVKTGGTPEFGVPRMPEGHVVADLPVNFVKYCWPRYVPLLSIYSVHTEQWPQVLGVVASRVLQMAKEMTPPDVCATILIEHAVPASKLPLLPSDAAAYPFPEWWKPYWEAAALASRNPKP